MTPTEQIREVIDINLISQITLTQYVSRLMVKKSIKGSIIFLTSIAGLDGDRHNWNMWLQNPLLWAP